MRDLQPASVRREVSTRLSLENLKKRVLERPGLRTKDKVNMYFGKCGWRVVNWIKLSPDSDRLRAVVNTVLNCITP